MAETNPIELQKALKGVGYPASRDELTRTAERNNASDEMRQKLKKLPDNSYDGPDAVSREMFHSG